MRKAFTDEKEFNQIKQHQKKKNARLSGQNGNAVGQTDTKQKKGKGKKKACRLNPVLEASAPWNAPRHLGCTPESNGKTILREKGTGTQEEKLLRRISKGAAGPLKQFHCYIEPQSIRRKEVWSSGRQKGRNRGKEKQDQTPFKRVFQIKQRQAA